MSAPELRFRTTNLHVAPKPGVHKRAKIAGVGGNDNDLGFNGESERLGGKDDVNVEVERRRSRAPLLAGLCPKLCGEPQSPIGQGQVSV